MVDALWPFADQFRTWETSPPNGPLSFFRLSNEFHDAGCPLKFQGTAKNLWQLFDPTSKPFYPVAQYPHLSLDDFVCWLQLPSDVTGTEWYFGYVYFKKLKHRKKLFDEFRELAAQAGACLRTNPRFREFLWPCLQYLSQADRYPQLRDGEDIAWWIALLFTKPDICQLLYSACSRNDIADVVQIEIENAALTSKKAISSWQLFDDPRWPTVNCRVARPFREIPCPDFDKADEGQILKASTHPLAPTPAPAPSATLQVVSHNVVNNHTHVINHNVVNNNTHVVNHSLDLLVMPISTPPTPPTDTVVPNTSPTGSQQVAEAAEGQATVESPKPQQRVTDDGGKQPSHRIRPRKGNAGRPRVVGEDEKRDLQLFADWQTAKTAGIAAKDFCTDKGIKVPELDRIVGWVATRRRRGQL